MKKIAIAVVVALCVAVAKPAVANIVWATFAPEYCSYTSEFTDNVTYNEQQYLMAVVMSGDSAAYAYIMANGWNAPAFLSWMELQAQGGCW